MGIRRWDSAKKFAIVLEGLKEKTTIVDLCNRHGVSQTQYYKWRDQFLSIGANLFETGGRDRDIERLQRANTRLKVVIGELTAELKKNDFFV